MTAAAVFSFSGVADAQVNSWATTGAGLWQTAGSWSLGVAPTSTHSFVFITNVNTKTVSIISNTPAANLTISNLTLSGPVNTTNTLTLSGNPGTLTLRVLNGLTVGSNSAVLVTNAVLRVDSLSGADLQVDGGTVTLNTGSIVTTNGAVLIGNAVNGQMTVLNGLWKSRNVGLGVSPGAQGTLTLAGGTNTLSAAVGIGENVTGTSSVWMTGGQLVTTNNFVAVGYSGPGAMTVSNGTWLGQEVYVGTQASSQGTLMFAGGATTLSSSLLLGLAPTATGAVWLTGGTLTVNDITYLPDFSVGQMTVSNGTWQAQAVHVAFDNGSEGTLTVAGGTNTLSSYLHVGGSAFGATGNVWLTGGKLIVTNSVTVLGSNGVGRMTVSNGLWLAHDVSVGHTNSSSGTLTIAGGTNVLSDVLRVGFASNATGSVWVTGGQLIKTNLTGGVSAIGYNGTGQMTVSNGTWLGQGGDVIVGYASGGQGTLTIAGGTNDLAAPGYGVLLGEGPNATGTLWLTGGWLLTTNGNVTVGANGIGAMSVSNGTWIGSGVNLGAAPNARGTLTIAGGTSAIRGSLIVPPNGGGTSTVWVTGGQLVVTNTPTSVGAGSGFILDGGVTLNSGGAIVVSNGLTIIGNVGSGSLTNTGGSMLVTNLRVGSVAGACGTVTTSSGTITSFGGIDLAETPGSTGTLWLTGGSLVSSNVVGLVVGNAGAGQMTVSNGTTFLRDVYVGFANGSVGTLTMAGGTNLLSSVLYVGRLGTATGTVRMTGGRLVVTNAELAVGVNGIGQMIVSNGTTLFRDVYVGFLAGSYGTLTVAGGTNTAYTSLTVGTPGCISTGIVAIAGGSLFVTNAAGNAVLEIDSGTVTLSSGTLRVDTFAMTNACAHFSRTGGTFIYNSAILDPNLDTDGDGLPNGWEQAHGLDPLSSTGNNGAAGDPDGDGFSNLQEYNFGSNPNDSSSVPVNSWTNSASSKWETTGNWSLGLAPTNNQTLAVTNALSKTVTIDATTSGSFPSTMTISNLTISGAGSSTNALSMNNGFSFPLHVRDQLILSNNGAVVVEDSEVDVDGSLSVGGSGSGNQLTVTNGFMTTGGTVIGGLPGSNNSIVVTGFSEWDAAGSINVRNSGPGVAIKVAEGAFLLAFTNVFIGNSATADGNIVVVTDYSYWENDGVLSIGGASQGAQFVISNGAQAFSSSVVIGSPVGAGHSATLTGTGSIWQVTSTIQVGNGGTNDSLTISDAGSLLAGQIKVNGATLVLNGGTFSTSSLIITNGGAVQYAQTYKVDNSTVSVASGTVEASSNLLVASSGGSTGVVNITGGQLVVTNGALSIGNNGTITAGGGVGLMTVSNATLLSSTNLIGSSAGGKGDLILAAGGQIVCPTGTNCLMLINSLGFDQIGGTLTWVGSTLELGVTAAGDYNVSGGQATFDDLYAGYGNVGTMTMAGGVANVRSRLIIGHLGSPVSTGAVWITGGQLSIPNDYTLIGNSGVGQMAISNGMVNAADVIVGNSSNPGTLTLAGGTLTLNSLVLPNPASRFIFSGGCLNAKGVTNANGQVCILGDAVTSATLSLLGGITLLDNGFKVSTNATLSGLGTVNGTILNYGLIAPGGLLIVNGVVTNNGVIVAPDGGSIDFNGQVVNNGLIVTNSAIHFNAGIVGSGRLMDAAADNDGDGMNNMCEALAGTNPTNSASVLRVVTVAIEGNDVRVTWKAAGGRHYVVQASTGTGGNYNNIFTDISPVISASGVGESTANYLDPGAANSPARYYRIRLGP